MSLSQAIEDVKRISQGSFSVESTFTNIDGSQTATVNCLSALHFLGLNLDTGAQVSSENANVSVHESILNDEGYTTRNSRGEISLKDHKVTITHRGNEFNYKIDQCMPNETTGLIVCTLGRYTIGSQVNPEVG